MDSHLFYFQVRRSAEHSLNMPLRLSLIPTNWFVIHFEFPHIWDILNLEKCLPVEKETNMRCFNIRFVWGALAEDNGNHLDPGDRGILRCRGRNDQINHNLSNWSRVVKLIGYHQIGKISSNKNTPYQVYHISSNWWTWFKIWMNSNWFDWHCSGWTLCSTWGAETANPGCSSFATPSKRWSWCSP